MFPLFCYVQRTMITRSALVVLHGFTSAERVQNVGRVLQVFWARISLVNKIIPLFLVVQARLKEGDSSYYFYSSSCCSSFYYDWSTPKSLLLVNTKEWVFRHHHDRLLFKEPLHVV